MTHRRERRREVEIPVWAQQIRHDMLDAGVSITELANEIGMSRAYVSGVLNGTRISPETQQHIERWHEKNFPTT